MKKQNLNWLLIAGMIGTIGLMQGPENSQTLTISQASGSFVQEPEIGHKCTWEDCEVQGETVFYSQWGYEEGTDGYCVELAHFQNPVGRMSNARLPLHRQIVFISSLKI